MKKTLFFALTMFLLSIFVSNLYLVSESRGEEQLPKIITMTSYPEGTAAYAWTMGFRQAIEKFSPMKMRLEPYGSDLARVLLLKKGESELACASGGAIYIFSRSLWGWKKHGPQPMQVVWSGNYMTPGLCTKGDSDIKSISDLRGKRVPYLSGGLVIMKVLEANLAYAGLTWDDVQKVKVSSMRGLLGGILKGSVDVTLSMPFTPVAQTLASGRHGIGWLSLPRSDTEGWKRTQTVAPWVRPCVVPFGPGLSKEKPAQFAGFPNGIYSYDNLSEEIVYAVAKAMHQGYKSIKDMHPDLKRWTIDQALNIGWMSNVPYHKGSIKYFKEIGRWTAEHEKWQEKQLADEKGRLGH
ncbi:TAXI family TRAP transporter solute-binding subunit [Thermodesulfobacteriota bacterium]